MAQSCLRAEGVPGTGLAADSSYGCAVFSDIQLPGGPDAAIENGHPQYRHRAADLAEIGMARR